MRSGAEKWNGTGDPHSIVRRLARLFGVAPAINVAWEVGQSPLYAPMGRTVGEGLWRCFVASLGDGVLVLLIVVAGWLVFRRLNWTDRPGAAGYVFAAAIGTLIAISVESVGLWAGQWSYAPDMPRLPGSDVGLVPVIQMLVLPPIVFWINHRWRRR